MGMYVREMSIVARHWARKRCWHAKNGLWVAPVVDWASGLWFAVKSTHLKRILLVSNFYETF
jgi:hypothetical protein